MKTNYAALLIALSMPGLGQAYQNPRIQAAQREAYQLNYPHQVQQRRLPFQARPSSPLEELGRQGREIEGLKEAIGLNEQTGEVHNSTESLFTLELDSAAAYAIESQSFKLGLSVVLFKYANDDGTGWRGSLDFFNDLVGVSIRYTFKPVLRPSIGIGYGTSFGSDRDLQRANGQKTETLYVDMTVRFW